MQDILTLITVGAAIAYLVKVFVLPSLEHDRKPDVPLSKLLRKARAKRYSVSPLAKRS